MILWNQSFATGHPQIDKEHQVLIEKLNELERALLNGQAKEQIDEILRFLELYAGQHFRNEEQCFHRHRCPVAAENISAHREFIRHFGEAKKQFAEKGASARLVIEIHRSLSDWVRKHILTTDSKIKPCLPK